MNKTNAINTLKHLLKNIGINSCNAQTYATNAVFARDDEERERYRWIAADYFDRIREEENIANWIVAELAGDTDVCTYAPTPRNIRALKRNNEVCARRIVTRR